MAKLFFRYSAMDAGKTLDLIKVAFNYKDRNKNTLILNSHIDRRAGLNKVKSRVGIECDAISISDADDVYKIVSDIHKKTELSCILIDEVQFFTIKQIESLGDIADFLDISVICYGLRTDFMGEFFKASARLLSIADEIEELKTICHCGKKATFNLLIENGIKKTSGDNILPDTQELKSISTNYVSVCRKHWKSGEWK